MSVEGEVSASLWEAVLVVEVVTVRDGEFLTFGQGSATLGECCRDLLPDLARLPRVGLPLIQFPLKPFAESDGDGSGLGFACELRQLGREAARLFIPDS